MLQVKAPKKPAPVSDSKLWTDWFKALRGFGDNHYGVEIRTFGSAVALVTHGIPVATFNRVLALDPSDAELIPRIWEFFRERGLPCRFYLAQPNETLGVVGHLRNVGFAIADVQAHLQGQPTTYLPAPPQGLTVREVSPHEFDFFSGLYALAYYDAGAAPEGLIGFRAALVRSVCGRPGWRVYMSFVDDQPAGGAILQLDGGVATLAGGATLNRFRGRGCQTALLERRLADAAEAGCTTVVSRCSAGTTSQSNMERLGLRLTSTKDIWEPRPLG